MHELDLATIDLNLLHVVATVLEKGSATRAARSLHVTQSAVSNALKRARELFGDELVIRRPHGFEPTPRAAALLPSLRAWLEQARHLIADAAAFDPAQSTRTFRIACADAVAITLLRPILRLLGERAPGTRLRMLTLDRLISEDGLARGEVDLLIGSPPTIERDQGAELVYRDPMACIVRRDHPTVRKRLSLDAYAALAHVDLALFGMVDDTIDRVLAKHGRARTVRVALPHFASVPLVVVETDCVATLTDRIARVFAAQLPIRVLAPPVPLQPIEIRQVWHQRAETDEAVRFLRAIVRDAARLSAPSKRAPRRS
ncbi:LysR family transcriptional regulator [Haliangium sp.]|uniref:LysR family transcriptional regulator n=1 Tax=Haliangium sp. TaxID=2663208 RepID=UPI003D1423D7